MRLDLNFGLTKRQKIIVTSVFLTIGLLSTQLVDFNLRFRFIAGLGILAYTFSLWALWEGINKFKAMILLILPTLFTLAVASSYFLLPIRWLTRLPFASFYGLSFYLLLLSQNVFNVASIRTIPLHRAASTAAFVATIFTAIVAYDVIRTLDLNFPWNGLIVFCISFLLVSQVLWSIKMEDRLGAEIVAQSFILALVLGEFAIVFSFWPFFHAVWAIMLGSALYVLLGITTYHLQGRLKPGDIRWYLIMGSLIWIIGFVVTPWTG